MYPGMSRLPRALAIVLLALVSPAGAQEETIVVRSEGRAEGLGFAARDAAIANAREQALADVLTTLVGAVDLRDYRAVFRNAAGYVPHYDVLREDAIGEMTRVEIDAQVALKPLHRDVAALMLPRLVEAPRIQLLIAEKVGPAKILTVPDFGVAEVALRDGLEKAGMDVSGVEALNDTFTHASMLAIVQGGVASGSEFARSRDADVVIVGTATDDTPDSGTAPEAGELVRTQADVVLKVFRASDGKMLEELSSSGVIHGTDPWINGEEAARDACLRVTGRVIDTVVLAMLAMGAGDEILITVEQPGKPERVAALIQYLLADDAVRAAEETFYADNLARLRVTYSGEMVRLADMLAPVVCEGRKLDVLSVVGKKITVSF